MKQPSTLIFLSTALVGCLANRDLGQFEDSAEDQVGDVEEPTTGGGSEGSSGSGGEAPEEWPPAEGFDPAPDVGDGTLSEQMLVIAPTPVGTLYLLSEAERLGDTFQAWTQAAALGATSWGGAGPIVFESSLVVDNELSLAVDALTLPAGTHPFGAEEVVVDLVLHARLYADELLCGTLDIDFPGDEDLFEVPFAARPIDEVGAEPNPALACE